MTDADRIAALEARVRELEDADREVDQLWADNLAVRAERDALRERVRELEAAVRKEARP